jgi:fucose permease
MLAAMAMMGIGCTILVVSLNPLVASLVSGKHLASTLTAGQCVKAFAALTAPAIAALGVKFIAPEGGWRIVFAVFLVLSLLAALLLSSSGRADSESIDTGTSPTSLRQCLTLLRKPAILAAFLAVLCHVGSDVGITVALPQLFQKRLALPIQDATLSVTVYYVARLAGALAGILILRKISIKGGLIAGVALLIAGLALAYLAQSSWALYLAVVLLGLGNANICALIISRALLAVPEEQNTTSAVLTMGFAGGALFPLLMGFATDRFGIPGAIAVIAICIAGVLIYSLKLKSDIEHI